MQKTEENHIQQLLNSDKKITATFEIQKKVGRGSFGTLYQARNVKSQKTVALKIELNSSDRTTKNSNLLNEIMILERLKGVKGVPEVYSTGKWKYGYYIELQLLSSSLHEEIDKSFSTIEIKMIGVDLLQILKAIHEKGIVHQDLKPQNIMRDLHGKLFIIDFGLSAVYTKNQSEGRKRGFVGTPRYASLAAHEGYPQYPKDDIESLLYVLGSLLIKKAPWFELKAPVSNRLAMIQKYKRVYNKSWFKKLGKAFMSTYMHLQELQPEEQPDYSLALKNFQPKRKTLAINQMSQTRTNNPRRQSQKIQLQSDIVPNILIHHVDRSPRQLDNSLLKRELSRSDNSFSQIAQGDFLDIFQLLTSKILHIDTDSSNDNEPNEINQEHCSEPRVSQLDKYHQIEFKNPFSVKKI